MSNLIDMDAERKLVAIALHGRGFQREEAKAILEGCPPTTKELRFLLAGRTPSLHTGIYEQRMVQAAYPCEETINQLMERVWMCKARRELSRVAMSGTDTDVRKCWAVLRYLMREEDRVLADKITEEPPLQHHGTSAVPSDEHVHDPYAAFAEPPNE